MAREKRSIIILQYTAAITGCMTVLGYGTIISWSSPALPHLQNRTTDFQLTPEQSDWIGALHLVGFIFGFLLNPLFVDRIGRKWTLILFAIPQIVSWLMIIFAKGHVTFYVARLIGGAGYGGGLCAMTVYMSETGNKHNRGIFFIFIRLFMGLGFFITMFLGAYFSYQQMNFGLLMLPVSFVAIFLFMPDSSYFLEINKRIEETSFNCEEEEEKEEERILTEKYVLNSGKSENGKFEGESRLNCEEESKLNAEEESEPNFKEVESNIGVLFFNSGGESESNAGGESKSNIRGELGTNAGGESRDFKEEPRVDIGRESMPKFTGEYKLNFTEESKLDFTEESKLDFAEELKLNSREESKLAFIGGSRLHTVEESKLNFTEESSFDSTGESAGFGGETYPDYGDESKLNSTEESNLKYTGKSVDFRGESKSSCGGESKFNSTGELVNFGGEFNTEFKEESKLNFTEELGLNIVEESKLNITEKSKFDSTGRVIDFGGGANPNFRGEFKLNARGESKLCFEGKPQLNFREESKLDFMEELKINFTERSRFNSTEEPLNFIGESNPDFEGKLKLNSTEDSKPHSTGELMPNPDDELKPNFSEESGEDCTEESNLHFTEESKLNFIEESKLNFSRSKAREESNFGEESKGPKMSNLKTAKNLPTRETNLWKLFTDLTNIKALTIVTTAGLLNILSGQAVLSAYGQQIMTYKTAVIDPKKGMIWLTSLNVLACLVSTQIIENINRRTILIICGLTASISLLISAAYFHLDQNLPAASHFGWIPLIFLSLYDLLLSAGPSNIFYIYQGEFFANEVKSVAVTVAKLVYITFGFLTVYYFPKLTRAIGIHWVFFLYGFFCALGTVSVYLMAPESQGRTLEEIQESLRRRSLFYRVRNCFQKRRSISF